MSNIIESSDAIVNRVMINDYVQVVRRGGQFYGWRGYVFDIVKKRIWVSFVINEDGETDNAWFLMSSLEVAD
jgi:hypothetical protein